MDGEGFDPQIWMLCASGNVPLEAEPQPCFAKNSDGGRSAVHRVRTSSLIFLAALTLPAAGEEISLKDGTKIVGHMTAVTADKIEVETSYGKMQLKRSDIVGISFPENAGPGKTASEPAAAKVEAQKVDESLTNAQYINRTGKFTLTVPSDWSIAPDLRRSSDTLAALNSRDKMQYLMVIQEDYPGSLESYKEVTMLNARRNLANFEELAQSSATIDGKGALLVFYRGNLEKGSNLPVEFVSAIIQAGKTYTKVTVWCVEPLFHDLQPTFEKMLSSYRSTAGQTTAAASRP